MKGPMKPSLWMGLFVLGAAPYLALVRFLWFLTDDAYISFRYARNLASGLGLRFNPGDGQPVEGFSNFLWTALLAMVEICGEDMTVLAPWISSALGLVLLVLLFLFLKNQLKTGPLALFMGILITALSPSFAAWSTGGLETMLFSLLLFLSFTSQPRMGGVFAGLMALTRPEGIFWVLGLFLLKGMEGKWREARNFVLMAMLLFLPFLVFRWIYFGYPLPNTYYAKSIGLALAAHRGLFYTISTLLCFITPLVLLLLSPFCLKKSRHPLAFNATLVCFAFVAYTILSGGDFMAMGRFLAPAAPFFSIMGAFLVQQYAQSSQVKITIGFVICLVQLLPAFGVELTPEPVRRYFHFRWNTDQVRTERQQWLRMKQNLSLWTETGKALKGEGLSYVTPAIGAVGFYSDLKIFDMCGLVDTEVARRQVDNGPRRSAGHDKFVSPEYFLSRQPDILRAALVSPKERAQFEKEFRRSLPKGYEMVLKPYAPKPRDKKGAKILILQRRVK